MEKVVERYLVKKAKELRCLCYKFTSPQTAGVCDRLVIKDAKVYFVEMKDEDGKLSALQEHFIQEMAEQGIEVFVLANKKEVNEFFKAVIV